MTLTWFRTRGRVAAPALLLSLITLALPHVDSHHDPDSDFNPVVAHDESAHSIGSASSPEEPPRHCTLCHWSRSFRPLTQIAFLSGSPAETPRRIIVDVFTAAGSGLAAQPPLRSPPQPPIAA